MGPEEQCQRRCQIFNDLDQNIMMDIQNMLHTNNLLIRQVKTAQESIPQNTENYELVIRADKRPAGEHERRYNAPVVNEVAILMAGDPANERDIVIQSRGEGTKKNYGNTPQL